MGAWYSITMIREQDTGWYVGEQVRGFSEMSQCARLLYRQGVFRQEHLLIFPALLGKREDRRAAEGLVKAC